MANIAGGSIVWNLDVDDTKFRAGLKRAESAIKAVGGTGAGAGAGKAFKDLEGGANNAAKSISNNLNKAVDQNTGSVTKMAGAVAVGQAAYSAFTQIIRVGTSFLQDSVRAANQYQNALLGLGAIARAFGHDQDAATEAAKRLASDGLLTVRDSATGLKNLLASGFNLEESITLMERFKDTASFNRQAALSFGDAVRSATEGIKNGNSILVDNAGVTKNLSIILKEAGKSQQDVMNVQSDASVRQALYNGLLRETAPMLGNAAQLSETYAGAQARASAQVEIFKQNLGTVVQLVTGSLLQGFSSLIGNNQQLITSLGAAAVGAIGFAGALGLAVWAIRRFTLASIIAAATNPLVALLTVLSVLFGAVLYNAMNRLQDQAEESNEALLDMGDGMSNEIPKGAAQSTKAMEDLREKLAEIDDQIKKNKRDFREQLAEMIKSHQQKASDLQKQLNDENSAYNTSNAEKTADFKTSQDEMRAEHEKRVGGIQAQIRKEMILYGNANSFRMRDLQKTLAEENAAYALQSSKREAEHRAEVGKDRLEHDQKVAQLNADLAAEKALLNKHSASVRAIRNVTLLDEISKLKRSHSEQQASFAKQKASAIKNAQQTSSGVSGVWSAANKNMNSQMKGMGEEMGKSMGNGFKKAMKQGFLDVGKGVLNWVSRIGRFFRRNIDLDPRNWFKSGNDEAKGWAQMWNETADDSGWRPRASGGPVTRGNPYIVGEEGPEAFIPGRSGTILPADLTSMLAGGRMATPGGPVINQYNTVNTQVDMNRVTRDLAWRIKR